MCKGITAFPWQARSEHTFTLYSTLVHTFSKTSFYSAEEKNRKLIRVHWSTKCPDIRFEYFPSFNILFILGAKRKWRNYCYLRILFILLALVFPNLRFLLYRRQKKPKSIQHFLSSFQSFCTISLAQSLISLVAFVRSFFSAICLLFNRLAYVTKTRQKKSRNNKIIASKKPNSIWNSASKDTNYTLNWFAIVRKLCTTQ